MFSNFVMCHVISTTSVTKHVVQQQVKHLVVAFQCVCVRNEAPDNALLCNDTLLFKQRFIQVCFVLVNHVEGHSTVENSFLVMYSCVFAGRIKLHKRDAFRQTPAISGGMRKDALEWKYGLREVGDDPEPLINYLDVSIQIL